MNSGKMEDIKVIHALGLMSGSSLDGLDIAAIEFRYKTEEELELHSWQILKALTYSYPSNLIESLRSLPFESARRFVEFDNILGRLMSEHVLDFIQDLPFTPEYIASHGHTVFHNPGQSSTQIGNPSIIAAKTGILTIANFRNMDTAYGGQGAPLAPILDKALFNDYDCCINLGGIANISFLDNDEVEGFDVCGANQILNLLAELLGHEFDNEGMIAST